MSTLSVELQYKINEYDLYRKKEAKLFAEKTALQKKFIREPPGSGLESRRDKLGTARPLE